MVTTLLSRGEVSRHTQALHLLREVREAFARQGAVAGSQATFPDEVRVTRGALPGIPAFSLSVETRTEKGPGTLVQLYDRDSGRLLAVLDGGHLSLQRSSIVGALAADVLSRPDATNVALLGTGPVVSSALKALRLTRSLTRVTLYDFDLAASTEQALTLHASLAARVRACETPEEAVAVADIVVLGGTVPLPVDALRDGTHVTVLNALRYQQPPLPLEVLARARVFSDDPRATVPWAPPAVAGLAQVIDGSVPARLEPEQLTIFLSTGPAFLELVSAWHVFEGARRDESLTRLDFGG